MVVVRQDVEWQTKARCLSADPDIFFPERGGSSRAAREVCSKCEVLDICLEYAVINREQFGIWGGTSERERRKIRKSMDRRRLRRVAS